MKEKWTKIRKVFFSTLYLSAFTFGGGYVIVTLMKKKFVDELHWIDEEEMLDLVAIAQSAPGAIAVNGAIVVGYKLAGIAGAFAAIIGTIIPPFVILSVIFYFYAAFSSNYIVKRCWTACRQASARSLRRLSMIWAAASWQESKNHPSQLWRQRSLRSAFLMSTWSMS